MNDDPRMLAVAYVHKDGCPAATLTRTDAGTEFSYLREYLDRGGIPIATSLPLTDRPLVRSGRSVPAYFAGLLPEGRRLTALRRTLKVSADDELSLLLTVGSDPIGDVTVTPDPEPASPIDDRAPDIAWSDVRFKDFLVDRGIIDPISLPGVQEKVSGRLITVPLVHGGRAHLLKLTPPDLPRLVENEAFFLRHASRLPIPVVRWEVVTDCDGAAGLLVTRFDRVDEKGELLRLPVEDGTQLMGLFPGDKYSTTTEELVRAVAEACTSEPLALRSIFIQVAWAWASGNGDLHAKNVSVVGRSTTAGGTRRPEVVVAPVYDIPSTWPYRDLTLALPIGGRREAITRRRLLEFAATVGLPERAAASALDATTDVVEAMIDDLRTGGSPWRGKARDDLAAALDYRLSQIS